MCQACHPTSVFLMLWSRVEDEDHTLPALRMCGGEHGGPPGPVQPCPRGEDSPAQSTHLPWENEQGAWPCVPSPHGLRVGRCAPRVGCGEGGRGQRCPLRAQRPRSPWHPTTIYRPRGKKLGARWLLVAPPQSLPSTPAPRAQTKGKYLQLLHRRPGCQRQQNLREGKLHFSTM